jgi:hypothetical protein
VPAALLAQVQGTDADEDVVVFDLDEDEDGLEDADESADLDGSDAADLDATDLDATPDDAESDDAESDDDTPGTPTPADTPDAAPAGDEDTEDE